MSESADLLAIVVLTMMKSLACCLFPFLVSKEKAILGAGAASAPLSPWSASELFSRGLDRTGSATSNTGRRSSFLDSKLSAIIFAYSRSKSASSSGSISSSCRVTMMASSADSSDVVLSSSSCCKGTISTCVACVGTVKTYLVIFVKGLSILGIDLDISIVVTVRHLIFC